MSAARSPTGQLTIASLRRRAAAGLISTTAAVTVLGLAYACAQWVWRQIVSRLRPGAETTPPQASSSFEEWVTSPWGERSVAAASLIITWRVPDPPRGPGARLLRLQRVELATGNPVSRRVALVEELAGMAVRWIVNLLLRPIDRRASARRDTLALEIAELRAQHSDDRKALTRAMMDLYRRRNVNPLDSWGKRLLAHLIVGRLPAVLSPRNQDLPGRIAGTVVIVEPRHAPTDSRRHQR
jgi:hypothetical protein